MEHLKSCRRSNVLYGLAKAVGTMRGDESDSLMPARRMPMGLVEHIINFFCSSSLYKVDEASKMPRQASLLLLQVCCPDDYRQWLVSMFSLFGTKFVKLYSGPMWRVDSTSQEGPAMTARRLPVEVCSYTLLHSLL